MIKYDKKVTQYTYIFGDFDKDKIRNIDDLYPFDKKKGNVPEKHDDPMFYRRSRFADNEVPLSGQLKRIYLYNRKVGKEYNKLAGRLHITDWRVKSVPSTMKKLIDSKKHGLAGIKDLAAGKLLTENRKEATALQRRIRKHNKIGSGEHGFTDYYRNPKGGTYYAYHLGLRMQGLPNLVELQIKSRKMDALAGETHYAYKVGMTKAQKAEYKKRAKELYRQGY